MAQFSNVTYGSRFPTGGLRASGANGPIPMGTNPYGSYAGSGGGIAALLAGGLRGNDYQGPTPYYSGVTPSNTVTPGSVQAPPSNWQPSAGGLNFGPGGPTIDQLSTDPILMQIAAAGQRQVQDARSAALANAENDLIGYGGVSVPDSLRSAYSADTTNPILAALTDANTAKAAAANPDSTLARLLNQNTLNEAGLNQNENAHNLFYSSTRGNDLGTLANSYRSAQNDAAANLAQLLGQANTGVLDAEQGAQDNYLNALQGAWERWMTLNGNATTTTPQSGGGGTTTSLAPETYYNARTGQTVNYRPIARPGDRWMT